MVYILPNSDSGYECVQIQSTNQQGRATSGDGQVMYSTVPTGRPPSYGTNGMIATPHTLASSTGLGTLRRGGSAVDAAIAANAVLSVVYPHMAGLGGDGFWMIADSDDVRTINASGPAGKQATPSFYRDENLIPERGPKSAVTVPGAVDGWRLPHEEYGQLSWEDLFDDAVALARDGIAVTPSLSHWIRKDKDILTADSHARRTFLIDGAARPQENDCASQHLPIRSQPSRLRGHARGSTRG